MLATVALAVAVAVAVAATVVVLWSPTRKQLLQDVIRSSVGTCFCSSLNSGTAAPKPQILKPAHPLSLAAAATASSFSQEGGNSDLAQ